jgi:hypothetical protein
MKKRVSIAGAFLLLSATLAYAQAPAQSLSELERRLDTGETIQIFDRNLEKMEGRFDGISGSSLRLIVRGALREIPVTQIFQVRQQHWEPDGILIGLGIGAAVGLSYVHVACRGSSEHEDCLRAGSLVIGAPAAAVGALIDWGIKKFDVIFERAGSLTRRLHISPLLAGQQKGIVVSVVF